MTAVSNRFTLPLAILLLLSAVPVVEALVAPNYLEDCANPAMLFDPRLIDENSIDVEHYTARYHRGEGVTGTIEPSLRRDAPLHFQISRAYGLPNQLLHPTAPGDMEPDRHEIDWIEVDGEKIPVHMVFQTVDRGMRFAAYLYGYGERPITGPFLTRLREAPREIVSGARPITLLSISGTTGRLYRRETERRAQDWIVAAWKHYQASCRG